MKHWLIAILALGSCGLAAAQPSDADLAHARKLLASSILFDGHNDLPWAIRTDKTAQGDVAKYDLRGRAAGQTDIARARAGGLSAQFWSVYVPGELTREHGHKRSNICIYMSVRTRRPPCAFSVFRLDCPTLTSGRQAGALGGGCSSTPFGES